MLSRLTHSPTKDPVRRTARRAYRPVVTIVFAIVFSALTFLPGAQFLTRLSLDLLLPVRHWIAGPLKPPARSAVAVVVIDEETYRTPPFTDLPKIAWTPALGEVIAAIDSVDPAAIGLDLVYPTSLDRQGLVPGFDRPFLKSLFAARKSGRLVMGEVKLSNQTIAPYPGQIIAAGGRKNLRLLNLLVDLDDVVRRYPTGFPVRHASPDGTGAVSGDRGWVTSFGVELVRRATRHGVDIPSGPSFLINYNTGPGDIPAYSFADVFACAKAGNTDYLRDHFAGKIVLIGTSLDVEDRRTPAKRFVLAPQGANPPPRCTAKRATGQFGGTLVRRTMPGVFVHAAAINTLMWDTPLTPLPPLLSFIVMTIAIAASCAVYLRLQPFAGAMAGVGVMAVATVAGGYAFAQGWVVPVIPLLLGLGGAYPLTYAYRFVAEDQAKRQIKKAFGRYLAPSVVDELVNNPESLRLGGERRELTLFFSDIAGFTSLSETLRDDPERLVALINRYLGVITGVIEANGGYVDKYVGDAVMALWGAPLSDERSARRAVEAALDCQGALDRFNRDVIGAQFGLAPIGTRMGINTGAALVGNMGSASRFNYTATGDAVNLAARLEGANKLYGTSVMIGEDTLRALRASGDAAGFVLRRLDRIAVKGRTQPVRVYEVIGRTGEVSPGRMADVATFHRALGLYYRRRFADALDVFAALSARDPAAKLYITRCHAWQANPPPARWDRSEVLTEK